MKKLLIIMISIGLALGASAQKVGGGHFRGPRVIVRPSFGFGYGYGPYSPYYGGFYSPWYYPPYGYDNGYRQRPSRLDIAVQDIKTDYADRIKSVRLNTDIPGKERRQKIRALKIERDKVILQTQKDYYYRRSGAKKPTDNSSNNNNEE